MKGSQKNQKQEPRNQKQEPRNQKQEPRNQEQEHSIPKKIKTQIDYYINSYIPSYDLFKILSMHALKTNNFHFIISYIKYFTDVSITDNHIIFDTKFFFKPIYELIMIRYKNKEDIILDEFKRIAQHLFVYHLLFEHQNISVPQILAVDNLYLYSIYYYLNSFDSFDSLDSWEYPVFFMHITEKGYIISFKDNKSLKTVGVRKYKTKLSKIRNFKKPDDEYNSLFQLQAKKSKFTKEQVRDFQKSQISDSIPNPQLNVNQKEFISKKIQYDKREGEDDYIRHEFNISEFEYNEFRDFLQNEELNDEEINIDDFQFKYPILHSKFFLKQLREKFDFSLPHIDSIIFMIYQNFIYPDEQRRNIMTQITFQNEKDEKKINMFGKLMEEWESEVTRRISLQYPEILAYLYNYDLKITNINIYFAVYKYSNIQNIKNMEKNNKYLIQDYFEKRKKQNEMKQTLFPTPYYYEMRNYLEYKGYYYIYLLKNNKAFENKELEEYTKEFIFLRNIDIDKLTPETYNFEIMEDLGVKSEFQIKVNPFILLDYQNSYESYNIPLNLALYCYYKLNNLEYNRLPYLLLPSQYDFIDNKAIQLYYNKEIYGNITTMKLNNDIKILKLPHQDELLNYYFHLILGIIIEDKNKILLNLTKIKKDTDKISTLKKDIIESENISSVYKNLILDYQIGQLRKKIFTSIDSPDDNFKYFKRQYQLISSLQFEIVDSSLEIKKIDSTFQFEISEHDIDTFKKKIRNNIPIEFVESQYPHENKKNMQKEFLRIMFGKMTKMIKYIQLANQKETIDNEIDTKNGYTDTIDDKKNYINKEILDMLESLTSEKSKQLKNLIKTDSIYNAYKIEHLIEKVFPQENQNKEQIKNLLKKKFVLEINEELKIQLKKILDMRYIFGIYTNSIDYCQFLEEDKSLLLYKKELLKFITDKNVPKEYKNERIQYIITNINERLNIPDYIKRTEFINDVYENRHFLNLNENYTKNALYLNIDFWYLYIFFPELKNIFYYDCQYSFQRRANINSLEIKSMNDFYGYRNFNFGLHEFSDLNKKQSLNLEIDKIKNMRYPLNRFFIKNKVNMLFSHRKTKSMEIINFAENIQKLKGTINYKAK